MRGIGHIAFWIAAIGLLAIILVSLDYSLVQGLFIGLMFCPCALALEFWMLKAFVDSNDGALEISDQIFRAWFAEKYMA